MSNGSDPVHDDPVHDDPVHDPVPPGARPRAGPGEADAGLPVEDHVPEPEEVESELVADAEAVADQVGATTVSDPEEWTAEQLDTLVAERDQFLAAYQRTAADFDNFRKLSQKRIADEVARAQGGFVERLLPVLDAVDAARVHAGERGEADDGVEALAKSLFTFLEKEGLERVDPVGEPFDPNVAEAVMHEPADDHGEPTVVDVLRTGYLWNGRVIRPAMVKVAG